VLFDLDRDAAWLARLREGDVMFDAHCVECGRSSTFRTFREATDTFRELMMNRSSTVAGIRRTAENKIKGLALAEGQFALHLACQRHGHVYSYIFRLQNQQLVKIGQVPSIEDVASEETDRLRPVLGRHYGEMRRAGGLFAHSIGIGSFVYLRRVFESLIEEHRRSHEVAHGPIQDYEQKRMDEKVAALRESLPAAVVANARAYSILSKGIHELSDDECLAYFPVLRRAVVIMLEEAYDARRRRDEEEDMRKEMAQIDAALRAK
jgi:hypothetical protein